MFNKDEDDKNSFVYPGMKKKVKAKIISMVEDLLEAQKAVSSDTSNDVDTHEKPDLGFLFKPTNTRTQSATKIVEAYIDHCLRAGTCRQGRQGRHCLT